MNDHQPSLHQPSQQLRMARESHQAFTQFGESEAVHMQAFGLTQHVLAVYLNYKKTQRLCTLHIFHHLLPNTPNHTKPTTDLTTTPRYLTNDLHLTHLALKRQISTFKPERPQASTPYQVFNKTSHRHSRHGENLQQLSHLRHHPTYRFH